ncbi:MAG: 4Fe-4S binding protein [Methanocellales archaeon]|nr:4Fe-4S binding protein [Methanocellales archaeon]
MPAKVDVSMCVGCGVCVNECLLGAISLNDEIASVDETLCTECGACIDACPSGAISLK